MSAALPPFLTLHVSLKGFFVFILMEVIDFLTNLFSFLSKNSSGRKKEVSACPLLVMFFKNYLKLFIKMLPILRVLWSSLHIFYQKHL